MKMMEHLLAMGAGSVAGDSRKESGLVSAIAGRHLQAARLLLDEGFDIECPDAMGTTPLFRAIRSSHLEGIRFLLDHGAKIESTNAEGKSPLHIAVEEIPTHLCPRGNSLEEEETAELGAVFKVLMLLISKGADIHARDKSNGTVLHAAVRDKQSVIWGNQETRIHSIDARSRTDPKYTISVIRSIEYLVKLGIDINAQDNSGRTALYFALLMRNVPVMNGLIANGADIEARDENGRTPLLFLAVIAGRSRVPKLVKEAMQALIDGRADPTAKDNDGKAAADWAPKYLPPLLIST